MSSAVSSPSSQGAVEAVCYVDRSNANLLIYDIPSMKFQISFNKETMAIQLSEPLKRDFKQSTELVNRVCLACNDNPDAENFLKKIVQILKESQQVQEEKQAPARDSLKTVGTVLIPLKFAVDLFVLMREEQELQLKKRELEARINAFGQGLLIFPVSKEKAEGNSKTTLEEIS
jgi:hypothetical protein